MNAVHWFQFWHQKSKNPSWQDFSTALQRRFGRDSHSTVNERLAALLQTASVEEYIQEYELLMAQTKSMPENQMLRYFLARHVCLHDPKDLIHAMEVARDIEEAMTETCSYGGSLNRSNINFQYQGGGRIVYRVRMDSGGSSAPTTNGWGQTGP